MYRNNLIRLHKREVINDELKRDGSDFDSNQDGQGKKTKPSRIRWEEEKRRPILCNPKCTGKDHRAL